MKKLATKSFSGGINTDVDVSLLKENQYRDALNFKLIANEDGTSFAIENAEGNRLWLDQSDLLGLNEDYHIVGHCYIKPYLVLFYTTNVVVAQPELASGVSVIARITVDKDRVQEGEIIYTDGVDGTRLNLSTTYPIEAVGHYEVNDNIKVYFTDEYNNVRWVNIMDENLSTYKADMFDMTPDFPFDNVDDIRPVFKDYIAGNITASTVQYAYQYYIEGGSTTMYSPASKLIPMLSRLDRRSEVIRGAEEDEESAYGVVIGINIPANNRFTQVRVVRIQYNRYNGEPVVAICAERNITPNVAQEFIINDGGTTLYEITYNEYLVRSSNVFSARTLAIKDNYLFTGNIRETAFDVDIDCRAYRFNVGSTARVYEDGLTDYYELDSSGNWTYSAGGSGTNWSIPDTADCANRYNQAAKYASGEDNMKYMYQSDGATWGATGPNVTISFDTASEVLDNLPNDPENNKRYSGFSETAVPGERSFQRSEVYRVGLVFRNAKLQTSPVKWVCDLKMPYGADNSGAYALFEASGSVKYRNRLGITVDFTGNLADLGAVSWEVVYVPRESKDRSVLAQGLVQHTLYDDGTTSGADPHYYPDYRLTGDTAQYDNNGVTDSRRVTRFISPEVAFNKNLKHKEEDYLHYLGSFNVGSDNHLYESDNPRIHWWKLYNYTSEGTATHTDKQEVQAGELIGYTNDSKTRLDLDGYTYGPFCDGFVNGSADWSRQGATSTHFAMTNFLGGQSASPTRAGLYDYKRPVFDIQYGGYTYEARQNNQYVSISNPTNTGSVTTYEGDTFIEWFWYLNTSINLSTADIADTNAAVFLFPVESSIATGLSLDDGQWRHKDNKNARLIQEPAGDWQIDPDFAWHQEKALFQYNPVYSQVNNSERLLAETDDFETVSSFPTRIKRSEKKVNGSEFDSFTKFLPNNFIDLNGEHGPLNNLLNFSNSLFYWQDSAFGIASVNIRSLVQDNNPGVLAVGTGGVLDRFDYLSESIGNQSKFGIATSRSAIYWGDCNKNELFKYAEGLKSVSKLGGIQTWLNKNGTMGEIKATYDHKYNDIIFTITFGRELTVNQMDPATGQYPYTYSIVPSEDLDRTRYYNTIVNARYFESCKLCDRNILKPVGTIDWELEKTPHGKLGSEFYAVVDNDPLTTHTITFNEVVDAFVSRNSFTPSRYLELDTSFLSTNVYVDLYIHNDKEATRSTYYGTTFDSEVTTLFNSEFPYTKVWDNIRWYSKSEDTDGVNQFKDTFDTITIYNDYQHTGDRDLYYRHDPVVPTVRPTEIVRRDRTFSMQVPRSIINYSVSTNPDIFEPSNWDESREYKERIRDKYMVVHATYNNNTNNTISIPYIVSTYRRSIR